MQVSQFSAQEIDRAVDHQKILMKEIGILGLGDEPLVTDIEG